MKDGKLASIFGTESPMQKWWRERNASDPVKSCDLYKAEGCAHVDGMLCDFPTCQMLKDWQSTQPKG